MSQSGQTHHVDSPIEAAPRQAAPRLDAMLRPRSVAVLGASGQRMASANQAIANLQAAAFTGEVHVVHRSAPLIQGIPTVPTIVDLPDGLDTALVSLPAPAVVAALTDLERAGCRSAVVPTVGLTEEDRRAIEGIAARGSLAIHGPNCFGILNLSDAIPLVFWEGWLTSLPVGRAALVSQSGGAAVGVVKSVTTTGFSKVITSGNEWATSAADYLAWLAADPHTDAVGLVLESIADVDSFVEAVGLLRAAGKPLVVMNVGRSQRGAALARAHSSGLVGRAEGYQAFFRELDVPTASDYDELASILDCYATPRLAAPSADGIGVITESGGIAAMAADIADAHGVRLAEYSDATRRALAEVLPGAHVSNPFDSGGSLDWDRDRFAEAIGVLARDPNIGTVVVVADAQAGLNDVEREHEVANFEAIRDAVGRQLGAPVVVASSSTVDTHRQWRDVLGEGVPLVRGIGNALAAAQALGRNRDPVTPNRRTSQPDPDLAARVAAHSGVLPTDLTHDLLAAYGVETAASMLVSGVDEALDFAATAVYPVVLKAVHPDLPHRSDVGGVVTGIEDEAGLRQAFEEIVASVGRHRPDLRVDTFEVQAQVETALEAMVGFVRDAVFGPIVTVGMGGVLVELVDDGAFALAPVSREQSVELIRSTRLATLAGGYRGLTQRTDLVGLAECLARFSALVSDFRDLLAEGDLNPVLIDEGTGRVRVVDALLIARDNSHAKDRHD